jgi:acyl-CoA synthetase (AMP-forming)/AMP-acid ligase II
MLEIESEFGALLEGTAELPDEPIHEDDPAVILYTSGTTGRPKGALASHRGIVGFVQTSSYGGAEAVATELAAAGRPVPSADAPRPQAITLATSPMFHLSGLYATIALQLALGGKLVIRSGRFDEAEVIRLMAKERVTAFSALGSMGPRIARHPELAKHDLSCVENVGFGGAPVSPAVQDLLREAFPGARHAQGMGYGSSETVSAPTLIRGAEYVANPTAAGRVIPTHEIEIRDERGNALPEGVEGEIHVRSPYVMLGYWGKPEATASTLKPGLWLATGDIGRLEKGLLYINSRARDLILRNAENVYPVEIEYRLEQHPEVREATVFGVDHEEWGQAVKAVVVPEPGASPSPEALARWCAETLAAYKVPTEWEIRREPLPRNPSGKVLKDVVRGAAATAFVEE